MTIAAKKKTKDISQEQQRLDKSWVSLLKYIPGYNPFDCSDGYYFDIESAEFALNFFKDHLEFVEGKKAGQPFKLERWQQAIMANLFGWKNKETGLRRFREAFIFIGRKNGKTSFSAGIVDFMGFCDREPGAQLYSAASERDQAALVYRHANMMIQRNPELRKRCRAYRTFKSIEFYGESFFKALSSDSDTKYGINAQLVINDELHTQKNRDLVDTLETSTASREQPLIIHITTAGYDRETICYEKYDYACKVRDGIIKDDTFLPVIYEADEQDDWTSPETWKKANPNLGVSISKEYLERECEKAQKIPAYENTFKRLHLNLWTQQETRWLSMEEWDKCSGEFPDLSGEPCYGGLDLSSTRDITAFVLAFPIDNKLYIKSHFWIPEARAHQREQRDGVPYLAWNKTGYIELTPGNSIDYEYIRKRINEIAKHHKLQEIAYDPYNATHLATQLAEQDGHELFQFRQGFISMNEPSKELERLILSRKIIFSDNPVLRWMASNAEVATDAAGNIKPVKPRNKDSVKRIDGIVSLIMAIGRVMFTDNTGSVYEDRGIFVV